MQCYNDLITNDVIRQTAEIDTNDIICTTAAVTSKCTRCKLTHRCDCYHLLMMPLCKCCTLASNDVICVTCVTTLLLLCRLHTLIFGATQIFPTHICSSPQVMLGSWSHTGTEIPALPLAGDRKVRTTEAIELSLRKLGANSFQSLWLKFDISKIQFGIRQNGKQWEHLLKYGYVCAMFWHTHTQKSYFAVWCLWCTFLYALLLVSLSPMDSDGTKSFVFYCSTKAGDF